MPLPPSSPSFLRAWRRAANRATSPRAVLLAKEKLEELKAFVDSGQEGQSGTSDDGYAWETRVSLYELPEKEAGENENALSFELLKLTVIVRWDTGVQERQMELSTLKAVKKKDRE